METGRDDFVIAIRSAFLRKGNQQKFSLLSLILFSIIILILGNFNFKITNFSRTIMKEIIYLSSYIVSTPENILKKSLNNISNHFQYYEDYEASKSELKELKQKDLSKQIITFENIELKKLIDDYFVEDSQTYAKVLTDKKSPFLRSIVINKGSKNGVNAGMIVYDDIYLVGKVVEVNFLTSRVLLISDINSKVPVTVQPLNIQGIMSGFNQQKGALQYIKNEKFENNNNEELIVVTSGIGGVFKSGIPIGKINSTDIVDSNKILVNFYKNFSQLKYVKILSHTKEKIQIDQNKKKTFKENNNQILKLSDLKEANKILLQKQTINKEVRSKFEEENTKLKENLIEIKKELIKKNEKIISNQAKSQNIKFLKLNLLHGPKCRKSFFRPNLFMINTEEYENCVLNKGATLKRN